MDLMTELLSSENDIMDNIIDNISKLKCVIGLGMTAFDEDGKAEAPVVQIRGTDETLLQRLDCLLFWRIGRVSCSLTADNHEFNQKNYPSTAVLAIQDEKGKTCGAAVLSMVVNDDDISTLGMSEEEFMDLLKSFFAEIVPGVSDHFVGTLF